MKNVNLAIFENNDDFQNELKTYFDRADGYSVCAATGNGNIAIDVIKRYSPDVVIMNLVLSGMDGFGVLDFIKREGYGCAVIVVSNFTDDKIVNSAIMRGAHYYFLKPVEPRIIEERIKDVLSDKRNFEASVVPEGKSRRRVSSLDEKISNIFMTIGIPPHIKGFSYLREGIKMAVENPAIINKVTKELYPRIGEKFSTTASKVERAIRHAIEVAWNRGRTDAISAIFGARVYIGSERPTNSEFIALVADKLILEDLV